MATPLEAMSDAETGLEWVPLTAVERESFFDAIERHRHAVWRVTFASGVATALAALIVALLTAPIFYAVIALLFDLVNIVVPTPNLIGTFMTFVDERESNATPIAFSEWVRWTAIAAVPGAIVMVLIIAALRRAIRAAATFEAASLSTREPNPAVLAEQRFANVVQEMALAANLPSPRTLITQAPLSNAAVFGTDESHATIVISTGLLERLTRAELQGVAAHLIASIANGDMPIGLRAAVTLSYFNLLSRFALLFNDPGSLRHALGIFRALLLPTKHNVDVLTSSITESFSEPPRTASSNTQRTWRDNVRDGAKLVVTGPIVMAGFFGGVAAAAVLGPLLAFAWRQRKYMADATAVRLTRDPDTLAHALEKMSSAGSGAMTSWSAHMSVSAPASNRSILTSTPVPLCPSYDRRLRALQKLGATLTRATSRWPAKTIAFAVVAFGIVGVLVGILLPLLAYVSLMLSMLFLGLPLGIVHVFLRWIGQ
jgi:Zn-dependent protease with chaperone function